MASTRPESCAFCDIVAGRIPATIVASDALTVAFLVLRQFHPGHVLVVPRAHVADVRDADEATAAAILASVARMARAVAGVFPNEGLSVWHSIGPAADQEVPHLHFHVHPRRHGDGLLRVYPSPPAHPDRADSVGAAGAGDARRNADSLAALAGVRRARPQSRTASDGRRA
jgi:histidine triad (HIT) family protein